MHRFSLSLAATLLATTALADVTPEEVYDVNREILERLGFTVVAEIDRTGDTLAVTGGTASVTFPMIGGGLSFDIPPHDYLDRGDGSVAVVWPAETSFGMRVDIPDEPSRFTGDVTINSVDSSTIVTGTPEELVYTTSNAGSTFGFAPDFGDGMAFDLGGQAEAFDSVTTVRPGAVYSITNEYEQGAFSVEYEVSTIENTDDDGFAISNTTRYGASTSTALIELPEGMNILDFETALRAGFQMSVVSRYADSFGETIQDMMGNVSVQRQATGPTSAEIAFGAEGLYLAADVETVDFLMNDASIIPLPITFTAESIDIVYDLPVLSSEQPADFRLRIAAEALNVSDDLWSLVDASGQLPRAPLGLTFDVGGQVTLGFDLMDIEYYGSLGPIGTPDIALNSLDVMDVSLSALDAGMSANGSFTFDNDDMQTIPGFPRPEGRLTVDTRNVQAALDQLEAAGLVGPSELSGARMGLAMFSTVTGEGTTETVVEVNGDGHVIVNGQRMY